MSIDRGRHLVGGYANATTTYKVEREHRTKQSAFDERICKVEEQYTRNLRGFDKAAAAIDAPSWKRSPGSIMTRAESRRDIQNHHRQDEHEYRVCLQKIEAERRTDDQEYLAALRKVEKLESVKKLVASESAHSKSESKSKKNSDFEDSRLWHEAYEERVKEQKQVEERERKHWADIKAKVDRDCKIAEERKREEAWKEHEKDVAKFDEFIDDVTTCVIS